MPSMWRLRAAAALDGEAVRLVEDVDVLVLVKTMSRRKSASAGSTRGSPAGRSDLSIGGMRTIWPASSRVLVCARPLSTRTWPVRISFCSRPNGSVGKVHGEPAVEPHAVLVVRHGSHLDAAQNSARATVSPTNSARTAMIIEATA